MVRLLLSSGAVGRSVVRQVRAFACQTSVTGQMVTSVGCIPSPGIVTSVRRLLAEGGRTEQDCNLFHDVVLFQTYDVGVVSPWTCRNPAPLFKRGFPRLRSIAPYRRSAASSMPVPCRMIRDMPPDSLRHPSLAISGDIDHRTPFSPLLFSPLSRICT